jgi:peptidyl-prolyl cis-trans isomerase SurA
MDEIGLLALECGDKQCRAPEASTPDPLPAGDIRLQVKSRFSTLPCFTALVLLSGVTLVTLTGCHPAPAPDVVATVNGKDIERADLERHYQTVKMSQGEAPQDPSPEQADLARLTILRQMIDEEIFQQRAAKLNVVATDEDVNAKVTEMKLPYTKEEFDKKLKERSETLEDLNREIRHQLTDTKLTNKEIDSKINITDAEITNFYAAHKAEFNYIEPYYNIARIAVSTTPGGPATNLQNVKPTGEQDARNMIQSLHQKLENGEDFGTLAMNYSADKTTGSNGGDMGLVPESQLRSLPDVYNAITKLKLGQFTDVLPMVDPTSHKIMGYAIYKLISKEAAGQRPLNNVQVQAAIRQQLREGHAQLLRTAYIEMLRDDAKVHNYLADQILKEGAK